MTGIRAITILWSLFPVLTLAIVAMDWRVVMACGAWLIGLYPLSAVCG